MQRATSAVVARRVTTVTAVAPVKQTRNLEIMSTAWVASWAMLWQWNFYTFFPLLMMDAVMPSHTVNKTPLLHGFEDKRVEMKLQRALDETVTTWSSDLDNASIDDAIARTF